MDIRTNAKIFLLALGGVICFLMGVFSVIVQYNNQMRKRVLLVIEFSTAFLLFADMLAYMYSGDTSTLGFWMVRICNFILYFIVYVELFGFNTYISTFMGKRHDKVAPETMAINVMVFIGMAILIVSQFTGWLYTFDSTNHYVRGPLFVVSFAAPFLIIIVTLATVIKYRKELPKLIFIASLVYTVLPMISVIAQAFIYGISFFNLSVGVAAIAIFVLSLIDHNMYLRIIAYTDKMVGIPNSYGYLMELGKLCAKREITKYDAIYFDIVRMGLINRKYGQKVGDYVIKTYATTIRENYMDKDEVLGRLGGNYFVAVLKKEHTKDFLQMLQGVEIPLNEVGVRRLVKVSSVAGVYQITDEKVTPDVIMTNVSMAVNIAKNVKKKPYIYLTQDLLEEMNEQRKNMEMIPVSMEKKEFVPFYQPKVNLETNKLCGAEALCRWNHDGAYVLPYKFVPLLEQNESICDFDFYMLHRVCEDIERWITDGKEVPTISVNFSRKNLGNPILAEEIYNVINSYDIPLNTVQIEITETIDEYPFEYLSGVVEALQRYGLTVAIDDFGVGSSSIRLIKDVSFDVLKIDKSFVDNLTEKDCKFLRYIIEMANESGALVIAEGVESEEQIQVLEQLGCHEIQGYYFDKPLQKEDFEKRLENPLYMK